MNIEELKKGNKIVKVEQSKQQATELILTTNTGLKVFEWVPKDRWLDIHYCPKGVSDEEISSRWENSINYMKSDISVKNILSKDNISVDVLEFSGTYISIDGIPKYYFFGQATKSSVKFNIKTNILSISYKNRGVLHRYELDIINGEMVRLGVI